MTELTLLGWSNSDSVKSCIRRSVSDVHELHRLALGAVGDAPQPPILAPPPPRAAAPKLRRDPGVQRVFDDRPERAIFNLPADLCRELEVQSLVINRPAFVRREQIAVLDPVQ